MKKIEEVLNNYEEYKTFLDDRFGVRFIDFLTCEQAEKIGFRIKEGYIKEHDENVKEWTRENILNQLKEDVEFGWEKACDERGISSSLMFEVVRTWNRILEEGLEDWDEDNYGPYGKPLFEATANKYGWELEDDSDD